MKPPSPPPPARRNRAAEWWLGALCFMLGVVGFVPDLDWFALICLPLALTVWAQAIFEHWIARTVTAILAFPAAAILVLDLLLKIACATGRGCL